MSQDEDRDALIALSTLCEPGNAELAELLHDHPPAEVLDRLCHGTSDSSLHHAVRARLGDTAVTDRVSAVMAAARDCHATVITAADPQWPTPVDDLAHPIDDADRHTRAPLCLWVRGRPDLAAVVERSVSVVGARDCSSYGRHVATGLGYDLAGRGWTVVSGGAYGIDEAAHRGALAAGGLTIAVLACGVDKPYPRSNAGLFDQIAETGLLVSEWPPGSLPQRHRFLTRNRVIAAISLGTVVVEAALRSGARQTARRAWELDRPLMLVPGPVTSAASAGVHQLARGPGEARLVTRADEIIEDLGRLGTDLAPPLRAADTVRDRLDPLAARVLDAMPRRVFASADQIAAQAGMSATDTARILPTLVMQGMLENCDNRYRLAP